MIDLSVILLVTVFVLRGNSAFARKYLGGEEHARDLNYLFWYHVFFIVVFTIYILKFGGDSLSYWNFEKDFAPGAKTWFDYFSLGTGFVEFLCFVPTKVMGLSYFAENYLFGMLGFIGLRYLYVLLYQSVPINVKVLGIRMFPFLFYLPNLHFWIAGIGKDTLCFFAIAWFLYSLNSFRRKPVGLLVSFALLYYVRPHVSIMIIIGGLTGIMLSTRVKVGYKFLLSLVMIVLFYLVYSQVTKFLRVDDLSSTSLQGLARTSVSNLSGRGVGSSIDIKNYSWPYKIFTFLFRPLFFDVRDVMSLVISMENLFYLTVMISGIRAYKMRYFGQLPVWLKVGFFTFVISAIVFADSLSNLGIVVRMKNMTMMYFVMVFISFISMRNWELVQTRVDRKIPQYGKTG